MNEPSTKRRPATNPAVIALLFVLVAVVGNAAGRQAGVRFGLPVKVTPPNAGGFEPAAIADRFGNVFVVARKETEELALAPDGRAGMASRSMSWLWNTTDGGTTFTNPPGTTMSAHEHVPGIEPDAAMDDAGHLYLVDMTYADANILRWTVTGRGAMAFDFLRPFVPSGQAVDDRPWVMAYGDGRVFYMTNSGDKNLYPGGRGGGPGRYTVYRSTDGGKTFDPRGFTLPDSGACRPGADHRRGILVVVCTNDGGTQSPTDNPGAVGTLWAYVSTDDGATFERYTVGTYNGLADNFDWPAVAVGGDGTMWALYIDAGRVNKLDDPTGTTYERVTDRVMLFRSRTHGKTWTRRDITPEVGRYRFPAIAVSPRDGSIGIGVYHRVKADDPWRVYSSVFAGARKPVLVSLDESNPVASASGEAPGELMGAVFDPAGRLNVVWTRNAFVGGKVAMREVWFTRSR